MAAGATDEVTARLAADGVPGCTATLIGPTGPVATDRADGQGRVRLSVTLPAAALPFVRAEVRRTPTPDGQPPTDPTEDSLTPEMVALTNPVFVDVA
jgi:hypothetical protein